MINTKMKGLKFQFDFFENTNVSYKDCFYSHTKLVDLMYSCIFKILEVGTYVLIEIPNISFFLILKLWVEQKCHIVEEGIFRAQRSRDVRQRL